MACSVDRLKSRASSHNGIQIPRECRELSIAAGSRPMLEGLSAEFRLGDVMSGLSIAARVPGSQPHRPHGVAARVHRGIAQHRAAVR
jgi:hypothetical protein